MEVRKERTALKIVLCGIAGLLMLLVCYLAAFPQDPVPHAIRFGVYPAAEAVEGSTVRSGDAVITDRNAVVYQGNLAVFCEENGQYSIVHALYDRQAGAQDVLYRVSWLGAVLLFLGTWRIVVWSVCGAVVVLGAVWLLTTKNRRLKRQQQHLRQMFDFYGHKYDLEDANEEY